MAEDEVLALVVRTSDEQRDVVSAALFDAGVGGLEERDVPGAVELVTYGTRAEVDAIAAALRDGSFEVRVEAVRSDWRQRWSESLGVVRLTEGVWVAPEGASLEGVDTESAVVLVLQRELAFGFGEHATTRMAARVVEQRCRRGSPRVLDFGTGGGLLALVARCAGAEDVVGVDVDAEAIATAEVNAARNRVTGCRFTTTLDGPAAEQVDLIAANVDLSTLREHAKLFRRRLAPGGVLVVTGILVEDERALVFDYANVGLVPIERAEEDDWLLLVFEGA